MLGRHDAIEQMHVHVGSRELHGSLGVPQGPVGLVVIAGSPTPSIADALRARGLATLQVDVELDPAERYDIDLLADRILAVGDWLVEQSSVSHLPLGYFAAGTCAAAALVAAARRPDLVRAVALADGRADLAGSSLPLVRAPTLLVAPGDHENSIDIDRAAIAQMTTSTQLAILPHTGPRFEEPGALDELVQLAAEWLLDHFAQALVEPAGRRGTWGRQFRDRRSAGERLAQALAPHASPSSPSSSSPSLDSGAAVVVFGLPGGGVAVAEGVAKALDAPLDVWLVRKIGMPIQPELGMGALAEGAALVLDPTIVRWSGATPTDLQSIVHRKAAEIRRRAQLYRGNTPAIDIHGKTVILVDDGIATAGTLRAAIRGARKRGAAKVIVAAPVAAAEALDTLRREADEIICLATPRHLNAVGAWYQDFRPLREHDVVAILAAARERRRARAKLGA